MTSYPHRIFDPDLVRCLVAKLINLPRIGAEDLRIRAGKDEEVVLQGKMSELR